MSFFMGRQWCILLNKLDIVIITNHIPQDGDNATVSEIQGGFTWPYFVLSASVLSEVDLVKGPVDEVHINLYNITIGT